MHKFITIGCNLKPVANRIKFRARKTPAVGQRSAGPKVDTAADRLHELNRGAGWVVEQVNRAIWNAYTRSVCSDSSFNVTVSVMGQFNCER